MWRMIRVEQSHALTAAAQVDETSFSDGHGGVAVSAESVWYLHMICRHACICDAAVLYYCIISACVSPMNKRIGCESRSLPAGESEAGILGEGKSKKVAILF